MVELATPIRLYWDFHPDTPAGQEIEQLCAGIAAVRFLSLHLHNGGDTLAPGLRQAMALLAAPGRMLHLSAALAAVERLDTAPSGIHQLTVTATTVDEVARGARVQQRFAPLAVGVSLPLPAVPLTKLPSLLAAAVAAGLDTIHFPMQRLTAGETCWTPTKAELAALAEALRGAPLPATTRLTIHDPFLWRIFHPDVPFPDGGCQAANTMLYLSPDGAVYPCPLVPVPLGRVGDSSLPEIVRGEAKRQIREQLRQLPASCGACPELAGCHAGCRGRAYVLQGWQAHDPVCGRK